MKTLSGRRCARAMVDVMSAYGCRFLPGPSGGDRPGLISKPLSRAGGVFPAASNITRTRHAVACGLIGQDVG